MQTAFIGEKRMKVKSSGLTLADLFLVALVDTKNWIEEALGEIK